jgi:hypothetical protein
MTLFLHLYRAAAAAVIPALFVGSAFACEPEIEDCVEIGKWELSLGVGAGIRTNPLEATPDIPLFLIPEVNYNGERFFIQNPSSSICWPPQAMTRCISIAGVLAIFLLIPMALPLLVKAALMMKICQ